MFGLAKRLVLRSSLLRISFLFVLMLCGTSSLWAAFRILFNGVVSVVNTGAIVLNNPADAFVDAAGSVHLSDTGNSRIVKIAPDGTASLLTITGLAPALIFPSGLAVDGSGNLYIADSGNARIVSVAAGGTAGTVLVVTATSGSIQHSVNVTLNVQ